MTHLLGLLALLSFVLLPGAVLISWRRSDFLESLGLCSALSIGINSFALMWLWMLGIYDQQTGRLWLIVLIVLTPVAWYLKRHFLRNSEAKSPKASWMVRLPWIALPVFAVVAYRSLFLPFFSHDAIASWNRWARDYLLDSEVMARSTFFYTQYMSLGQSFPYMISGDPGLEYYSHGMSFFHLLVLYAGLRILGRRLWSPGDLVLCVLFLTIGFFKFGATGYADVAATGFGVLAVALYFEALHTGAWRSGRRAWWAGLAAGTSYLFKQSTLPIIVLVPFFGWLLGREKSWRDRLALGIRMAFAMAVLVVPWYVVGGNELLGNQLSYVMVGIHGGADWATVLLKGWTGLLDNATFWSYWGVDLLVLSAGMLLFVLGFGKSREAVACGLAGLISVAIWMASANYEPRGAMPGLALVVVVSVAGLMSLFRKIWPDREIRPLTAPFQALVVLVVLVGQFNVPSWFRRYDMLDWRPGSFWFWALPWESRSQKLRVLDPLLESLEVWKESHPEFGRILADPLVLGAADPYRPSQFHAWLEVIDRYGAPNWRPGDSILLEKAKLQKMKYAWVDASPVPSQQTWEVWLQPYLDAGVLVYEGEYRYLLAYRVVK